MSDVKKAQEERQVGGKGGEARTAEVKAEEGGREERLPVKGIRKTIAEKMSKSKGSIPHAYHMEEIDMTEVARIREELKRNVTDVKITFLHFVMKAVATALGEYPLLNASFDEERNEIVVKHYVNLGVAVDTDQGLVVVVVKNADGKSLAEIAGETARLAEKARAGKLELGGDVMGGSTFTISNIGGAIGGVGGCPS